MGNTHASTTRNRGYLRSSQLLRARREITRTFWARVSASGATAFTAPVIVDRYRPDRGRSDPRSRDHEPRPSADQADGVMTDASLAGIPEVLLVTQWQLRAQHH